MGQKPNLRLLVGTMLLLIVCFTAQTVFAGITDYLKRTDTYKTIKNYTTSASNYITSSRPYNYITTSRPYNAAAGAINSIGRTTGLWGKGYPGMGGITITTSVLEKKINTKPAQQEFTGAHFLIRTEVLKEYNNGNKTVSVPQSGNSLSDSLRNYAAQGKLKMNQVFGAFSNEVKTNVSKVQANLTKVNNSPSNSAWNYIRIITAKQNFTENDSKGRNYTVPFKGFGTPYRRTSESHTTITPINSTSIPDSLRRAVIDRN